MLRRKPAPIRLKFANCIYIAFLRTDNSSAPKEQLMYPNTSMAYRWILILLGLAFFTFKPCVGPSASTAGLAAFTKTVKKYSKAASVSNTLIGTFSRSRSVATIALTEQEKPEEAKKLLAQTALTLSVLDVGGGMVLPGLEKIVDHVKTKREFENTRRAFEHYNELLELEFRRPANIDQSALQRAKQALKNAFKADIDKFPPLSKVGKAFSKASKWLKGASVFKVLGPLTDVLTIGINIWGLEIAIRDNNPAGIAAASLSIAAGAVGLVTFIAAVATGTAVLGPIGALVGAILGIAATLIELLIGPAYDKAKVQEYKERLGKLENLRDACRARIDWRMEALEKMGSQYSDVYVNNQAACISDRGYHLKMYDVQTDSKTSFYERKYVSSKPLGISEAQEEVEDGQYLCIGEYNFIFSPLKPLEPPFSGLGKEQGWVGFDFYGKFKEGTEYGGLHVFVDADFISDFEVKGVEIDTAKHTSRGTDSSTHQNDVISIGDYKMKKSITGEIHDMEVKTRKGHDSLNINGMIGKFESSYQNKLKVDLGEGGNVLSFEGISKDRNDIKGVFFDSKTGVVKYYHGQNRNTHTLGTVRNVGLFSGSPFDDHVILYAADLKVVQIGGRNVYEFNCDDLVATDSSEPRHFQIVEKSASSPKINLKTTGALEIKANDVILQNKRLKFFHTAGQSPRPIFEVLLGTESTGNLFINDAGSRPINLEHINPVLITGERKNLNFGRGERFVNYEDGDKSDLLFLKWPTHLIRERGVYDIHMKGGTDYVVISDKYLLDPSGIDGESLRFRMRRGFTSSEPNPDQPGTFKRPIMILIDKPNNSRYGFTVQVLDGEKIVNEYGDELVDIKSFLNDFDSPQYINLYDKYMEVTTETLNINTEEED